MEEFCCFRVCCCGVFLFICFPLWLASTTKPLQCWKQDREKNTMVQDKLWCAGDLHLAPHSLPESWHIHSSSWTGFTSLTFNHQCILHKPFFSASSAGRKKYRLQLKTKTRMVDRNTGQCICKYLKLYFSAEALLQLYLLILLWKVILWLLIKLYAFVSCIFWMLSSRAFKTCKLGN